MEKKQILVVDDDKDVLKVLEKRLSSSGYSVIIADNGNDAVRLAKGAQPDLILLDVVMPDIDGGTVSAILKNDPKTKNIPVIFLTCLITKGDVSREGHDLGGNFFIAKPYNPEELLTEVQKRLTA